VKLDLGSLPQVKERLKRAFPQAKGQLDSYFRELQRLVTPIEGMFTGGRLALPLLSGSEKAAAMFSFPFTNLSLLRGENS